VSGTVDPGGPFFVENRKQAAESPLVERLFQLPAVEHVLVADNVITIGKKSNAVWLGLKVSIGVVIRSQLLMGICAILESPLRAGASKRSEAEVRATVQGLLDREVNRSVASHGGQISIVDVRDDKLFIAMSGGCQGCTASQVTLKYGFELMVRRIAPEIVDIVDTTDHASGTKPFYQHAGEVQ
jgi:NFU1 iron-sulfur cluster scaffold homolog, mitochondrial